MTSIDDPTTASASAIAAVGTSNQATTGLLGKQTRNGDTNNNDIVNYGTLPGSDEETGQEETENPDRPTGIKFIILFLCILLGDFFVGYVSLLATHLDSLMLTCVISGL